MRGWAAFALSVTLGAGGACACSGDLGDVAVDLRTDLVPGHEFQAVRVDIFAGAEVTGTPEQTRLAAVLATFDYLRGVRVADLVGLPPGSRTLRVSLLDGTGRVIAERLRRLEVRGDAVVVVVITRDCLEASCPIDPECENDAECPAAAECGVAHCVEGTCLVDPIPGACGPDEYCDPDVGCLPIGGADAGPTDAGRNDAATSDAGADAEVDAGCTSDMECPAETTGEWSACDWGGACDERGSREREVTTWSCLAGDCVATMGSESDECRRDTDGTSCADDRFCDGEEICFDGECRDMFLATPCMVAGCITGCIENGDGTGSCRVAADRTSCRYGSSPFPMTGTCMSGNCCPCTASELCTTGGRPGCRAFTSCTACGP